MKRVALLVAAALLAACDSTTSPTNAATPGPTAQVIRNVRFERQTFAGNDCTGAVVAVDVTFHVVLAVTSDAAGGFHLAFHRNIEGTGVNAATGTQYVVTQEDHNEFNVAQGVEQTVLTHFNLISKGSAPNEVAQILFHITITPDGNVSSFHDSFRIQCGT